MLNETYFEMPSIIYNEKLDATDVERLTKIFADWCEDELAKREIKRGRLFQYDITLSPALIGIRFGNKFKYFDITKVLEVNPCDNPQQFNLYYDMISNMKQIAEDIVKREDLTLDVCQSGGLAKYYTVSRM